MGTDGKQTKKAADKQTKHSRARWCISEGARKPVYLYVTITHTMQKK